MLWFHYIYRQKQDSKDEDPAKVDELQEKLKKLAGNHFGHDNMTSFATLILCYDLKIRIW